MRGGALWTPLSLLFTAAQRVSVSEHISVMLPMTAPKSIQTEIAAEQTPFYISYRLVYIEDELT